MNRNSHDSPARGRFLLLVALGMVALRVLIHDHVYFAPEAPPNHDMSAGLAFFCTGMHSVRLTGDLPWWSPVGDGGCAQYYQSFFSPLAPTTSHVVFLGWAQLIRLLALVGVAVPEYYQYLAVNFVLLPFLAAWAFALFASLLFRRRATVVLVTTAWALSGIGVWNSAWFYFQEPFTLFLLLSACLAALRRPTPRRLLLLVGAALIQIVSVNYWTLYNTFFVVAVLGGYLGTHPIQARRLFRRAWQAVADRPRTATALGLGVLATLALWGVLLGSVLREQSKAYVRTAGSFSTVDAYNRVQEMRQYTLELFNPNVMRPLRAYPVLNEVHNARYIGCVLLPLLLLFPLRRWRRQDRWLVLAALGVLVVCLVPPWLLGAWKLIPQMDRIRHLFYFYTQYWQIMGVLLAGASFDALLRQRYGTEERRRLVGATGGLCALLVVLLIVLGATTQFFASEDVHLQGNLHFALLTLATSAALLQALWHPGRRGWATFATVALVLLVTDLSKYYWEVSGIDRVFTRRHFHQYDKFPPEVRATLCRPWRALDPARGWDGGLPDNLPIGNDFWPRNAYLLPKSALPLLAAPMFTCRALEGAPVSFSPEARYLTTAAEAVRAAEDDPSLVVDDAVLLVQEPPEPPSAGDGAGGAFAYRFLTCDYNGFALEVTAPRSGWVYLRQLHDPLWRVTVDGQPVKAIPALFAGTGVPLSGGAHVLRMDYRPLARRLYWPAGLLLEGTLAALAVAAARSASARAVRQEKEPRITREPHRQAA